MIWRSLWAEGLAVYVSAQLNPSNPLSNALLFPKDLEARAKPFVPQMASELLAAADRRPATNNSGPLAEPCGRYPARREDLEYGGVRIRTGATIAAARISIQVDVGFGE